jgi:hypothetical protein
MRDTWTWISGWAIRPDRFKAAAEQALPGYRHAVFAPTPGALQAALESGATRIGGYSLGSLIVLSGLARIPDELEVTCLAPFTAFCEESQQGGTTPLATLQLLQARLQKQPTKAIKLFYRLAGLHDEPTDSLPYSEEELAWGLRQLSELQVDTTLPSRVKGLVGLTDALVQATVLQSKWPQCNLIENCSHSYGSLLTALQKIETT